MRESRSRVSGSEDHGPVGSVYTVGEFTREVRAILESQFGRVAVRGEISNFSRPQSGHVYFSLIDDDDSGKVSRFTNAQIPVVMWRSNATKLRFRPESGVKVVVSGRVSVYEPRGTYQLIADRIVPEGIGALQLAFEQLKEKLQTEGLFAAERKRSLPFLPRRIGVITSPTGAALHDFLRIVYQRFPRAWVRLVPVKVQGEGAAREIARAVRLLHVPESQVEVIVLTRGGGSLEDLWAFNEEIVARALSRSLIPTVSAVGHEIDFTIADFVADCRAPTPTAAAEAVVADARDLRLRLESGRRQLIQGLRRTLDKAATQLERATYSTLLRDPQVIVQKRFEHLDRVAVELQNSLYNRLQEWNDKLLVLKTRLEGLSPLSTLGRGYSVTTTPGGKVIRDASQLAEGERIVVRFAAGQVQAVVQDREESGRKMG